MITISFEGGLGNQLFQFAYARYVQELLKKMLHMMYQNTSLKI